MQVLFGKYMRAKKPSNSAVFELKIVKNNHALPFDAVKPHQIKALLEVSESGFYHKITDPPVFANMQTRFNHPRPFDCMYLIGTEAFVVIWYYHERQPKKFIFIPISIFLIEKAFNKRKSLTEIKAREIGSEISI